ncbi:MAG: serine/threonine protein kinase [Deltaproteobacteria bacterium]|nr:serine/threonine protein kinase [Deltaproteobacteria bacterium]
MQRGEVFDGRFRVEMRLGRGGMGEVYKVFDIHQTRVVALKTLFSHVEARGGDDVERLKKEARILGRLDHPNIIKVFEFRHAPTRGPYFTMPYEEGTSECLEWLERQRAADRVAVRVAAKVFAALEHAHRRGVIHRDIKSSNVLVRGAGDDPHVLVIDWGISLLRDSARITGDRLIGTPGRLAPELIKAAMNGEQPEWSAKSDLYAAGILLYQMLCRGVPFEQGKSAGSITAEEKRAAAHTIVPAKSRRPDLPERLLTLIGRLLAESADERPRQALDVYQELEDLLRSGELSAARSSVNKARVTQNNRQTAVLGVESDPRGSYVRVSQWFTGNQDSNEGLDIVLLGTASDAKGEIRFWGVGHSFVIRSERYFSNKLSQAVEEYTTQFLQKHEAPSIFCDWFAMTAYDTAARWRLMRIAARHRSRWRSVHIGMDQKSPSVQMGVNIANALVGNFMKVHTGRDAFAAELILLAERDAAQVVAEERV